MSIGYRPPSGSPVYYRTTPVGPISLQTAVLDRSKPINGPRVERYGLPHNGINFTVDNELVSQISVLLAKAYEAGVRWDSKGGESISGPRLQESISPAVWPTEEETADYMACGCPLGWGECKRRLEGYLLSAPVQSLLTVSPSQVNITTPLGPGFEKEITFSVTTDNPRRRWTLSIDTSHGLGLLTTVLSEKGSFGRGSGSVLLRVSIKTSDVPGKYDRLLRFETTGYSVSVPIVVQVLSSPETTPPLPDSGSSTPGLPPLSRLEVRVEELREIVREIALTHPETIIESRIVSIASMSSDILGSPTFWTVIKHYAIGALKLFRMARKSIHNDPRPLP